jgi:hypothetical protein
MSDALGPNDGARTPEELAAVAAAPPPVVPVVVDELTAYLQSLGVEASMIQKIKDDLGAATVSDLGVLTVDMLKGIGMKPVPAAALVKKLNPEVQMEKPATTTIGVGLRTPPSMPIVRLQEPPNSVAGWLTSLCEIQPQIIQPLTVVTGVRAALADIYGFFQLSRSMKRLLREASDRDGITVPDMFFDLENLNLARRYGTLVAWMQGKRSACTIEERNRFLNRMHEKFWDAIDIFYRELDSWRQARRESLDVGEQLASAMSGDVQIFDTTQVRTAALAFGDLINHTFAGTGVYSATALQLDRDRLQEILNQLDHRLFGMSSRQQLLDTLGCAVPADMVAAENTVCKFVWNAMVSKEFADGGVGEQRFLLELAALGTSRPWVTIKALADKRKGSRRIEEEELPDDDDPDAENPHRRLSGIGGRTKRPVVSVEGEGRTPDREFKRY